MELFANLQENTSKDVLKQIELGKGLLLVIYRGWRHLTKLYRHGTHIKTVELTDKTAKRIFVTELVELGAIQTRIAKGLGISRQTINNYLTIKKYFGLEGLILGLTPSISKSRTLLRKRHANNVKSGCFAPQAAQLRRNEMEGKPKN